MHNTHTPKRRLAITGAAVAAIAIFAGFGSAQAGGQPPEPPSDDVEFEASGECFVWSSDGENTEAEFVCGEDAEVADAEADAVPADCVIGSASADPAAVVEPIGDSDTIEITESEAAGEPGDGEFEIVELPEADVAAGDEEFETWECSVPPVASAIECAVGVPAEGGATESADEVVEVTPLEDGDLEGSIDVITDAGGDEIIADLAEEFETFDCSTSAAADGGFATVLTETADGAVIEVVINIDVNTGTENLDN